MKFNKFAGHVFVSASLAVFSAFAEEAHRRRPPPRPAPVPLPTLRAAALPAQARFRLQVRQTSHCTLRIQALPDNGAMRTNPLFFQVRFFAPRTIPPHPNVRRSAIFCWIPVVLLKSVRLRHIQYPGPIGPADGECPRRNHRGNWTECVQIGSGALGRGHERGRLAR